MMNKWLSLLATWLVVLTAGFFLATQPVLAGTDLQFSCDASGCSLSPDQPMFSESDILPGDTFSQDLLVSNEIGSSANLYFGTDSSENTGVSALSDVLLLSVQKNGLTILSPMSLTNFWSTDLSVILDEVANGQTETYQVTVQFDPSAGNEYQNTEAQFDLALALDLFPVASPSPAGLSSDSNTSSVLGSNSVSPPKCTDEIPSAAPVLSATASGPNSVLLSWAPVSPATTYALYFTSEDGQEYGASDLGNFTSFEVNNLSGGVTYSFEVFAVNGCAAGPRSNLVTPTPTLGGLVVGPPTGPGGQTLGVDEDLEALQQQQANTKDVDELSPGTVLGEFTECSPAKTWLPIILLVGQGILLLLYELLFEREDAIKYLLPAITTGAAILLWFYFAQCDCTDSGSWLTLLCTWFWIVSIFEALLIRLGFVFRNA